MIARIVCLILCGLMTRAALAQDLPSDPTRWINSPPMTKEMLAGKAAVFYFIEEDCPNCARNWPGVLEAAAKLQGQPVLFVVVNSGTPRPEFEAYLRRNQVNWAAIHDWDRSFESQFGFEISLQNIMQLQVLLPDGNFQGGDFRDIGGSAASAAKTAKWKVDPTGLPDNLRPAWMAVEFGSYPDAARLITRGLAGKGPQAEFAQKLNQVVLDDLAARTTAAQTAIADGDSWTAYKTLSVIPARFKGFEIPADLPKQVTELSQNDDVKKELAAQKLLIRAQQSAAKSNMKAAIAQLKTLAKDYSETEAGIQAQVYIDQMNAPPATPETPPTER